jgi:hypothetical protein
MLQVSSVDLRFVGMLQVSSVDLGFVGMLQVSSVDFSCERTEAFILRYTTATKLRYFRLPHRVVIWHVQSRFFCAAPSFQVS